MIRKSLIKRKIGAGSVRWRLHSPTRVEALTDSVFAFAVTLIVVSLEVPKTFHDLLVSMKGFAGFAICFTMLMMIWYEQYSYFRKYGLQDLRIIVLNAILLFVVLLYVYPLKFLFGFLTQGNESSDAHGNIIYKFTASEQISELMIIYGCGFVIIYFVFTLMYLHALKMSDSLQLNRLEVFNTHTMLYNKIFLMGIGVVSVLLAVLGVLFNPVLGFYSGMCYATIGLVIKLFLSRRKKRMIQLFTKKEIEEVTSQVILMEIKEIKNT